MQQMQETRQSLPVETIRERILELLEIAKQGIGQGKKPPTVMLMGIPIVEKAFQSMEVQKLSLLLECLNEISGAVLDLDCSQESYQSRMVRALSELMEVAK